jgi:hypothetical protein
MEEILIAFNGITKEGFDNKPALAPWLCSATPGGSGAYGHAPI